MSDTGDKGPYAPKVFILGNPPSPLPDVPVSAVFLALFFFTGAFHMLLLQKNKKNDHKFIFSGAMFGFCFVRVNSCWLRIFWSYHQENLRLGIATQVFVAAGTVILYIINLFFTQRLMRARHPHIGWHAPFKILVPPITTVVTILSIIMIIVVVIQSQFTLHPETLRIDRDIQLYVLTTFTVIAFLPLPIVAIMFMIPRRTYIDKFGAGRFRTKVGILVVSSMLLTLGAGFRCGIAWVRPTLLTETRPWYFSKACFYIFDFTMEYLVILTYLIIRADRRFYTYDNASGPGQYSGDIVAIDNNGLALEDGASTNRVRSITLDIGGFPAGGFQDPRRSSVSTFLTVDPKTGRYTVRHVSQQTLQGAEETNTEANVYSDPRPLSIASEISQDPSRRTLSISGPPFEEAEASRPTSLTQ